ncbi:aldehyde dehydrogenase family protein [Mycobacterium aquaticum]|uniref:Aldehyde dehydrogenase n=1 Tax=Mycobacterium aquaticum TaxID=1927124 RepID=A0A1X0A9C9_9MYCO|nr:aldehyde dehydrogenase family protein [Mycobacterium aquaticum]ORA26276.1 aldehyde dehydrogenase [Mycobacterium aquaticum]
MTAMTTDSTLYIAGDWKPGHRATVDVINPATEELLATVPLAGAADADTAVSAAVAVHESGGWARRSFAERADALDAIADGIESRQAEFDRYYIEDLGGLATFAPMLSTISIAVFRDAARLAREMSDEPEVRTGSGAKVAIRRTPVGPVLAIVPFNGPLLLAAVKVSSALAAGCPVILRADVLTPMVSFLLAEVLTELELPPGLISIFPADVDISRQLVAHPGIAHISFTGSTAVGKEIMRAAAQNMTRLTLELGGKSAAIVLDDIDPTGVSMFYPGCLAQTGQVCTTYSRILVPSSRLEDWTTAFGDYFSSLVIGPPGNAATMIGPLASAAQRDRVERYVALAREEGTVITGGRRPPQFDRGFWYEPTLVAGVLPDARVAQEEVFGPVIVLLPYNDVDQAIQIANGTGYGLAGGVFTGDIARGEQVASRLHAGVTNINNFGATFLEPLGGFGQSGMGREGGVEGIQALMEITQLQYPPA